MKKVFAADELIFCRFHCGALTDRQKEVLVSWAMRHRFVGAGKEIYKEAGMMPMIKNGQSLFVVRPDGELRTASSCGRIAFEYGNGHEIKE